MTLRTTCPYCGVGCGLAVVDGVPQGDVAHPANFGRLCSKGAALKDTLALSDRLTMPLIAGRETSWNDAVGLIASHFADIRERHGPDAIAFYVSGQFLTEDYYVANKLMKGFIGSANIDTNSRLCMSSSVAGHVRAFGEDVVPGCYEDIEEADLVVQVGSNMAWCHPVLYQRLMAARLRRGTKIVAIDPRRTVTAETADLHLPLAQGSDLALFNGLLVHLEARGAFDLEWIARHIGGFEETIAAARRTSPSLESVAEMTGLGVDDVERFYSLFAATERAVTLYSQGVNQSVCGSDKVNAIINCHLATGRIGRTGMGPFSLTGQPNAMGGREVGGLANQLAAHMNFTPPDIDRVRRFWNAPGIAERPGLKAVEMFEAVEEGRIKAIWIAATNPAASMPRARRIREALANCPLVIVSDAWPTDTTRLARVVLPAASWAEKDGTVTNSERVISRQRAFRKAPGKARPDWWMFAQVGQRLGWEHAFSYRSSAEIFREHAELSSFENHGQRLFDLGALATLSDDAYDSLQPTRWPCPNSKRGEKRLFGGGRFATPDGRARMVPVAPPAQTLGGDYSLILNTGRVRDQWHTMTRTGRVPHLMTHTAAPRICLHPKDATRFGIGDGRLARIESAHGRGVMLAALDDRLRPGEAFLAMHWTDEFASTGPVGTFVHARRDPLSGQPDLKATPIRVAPVDEIWQGRLVRLATAPLSLGDTAYWCKMPLLKGAMYELAGWSELSGIIDSEAALRSLLAIPASAEIISYSDPKKMIFRYAGVIEGSLEACIHFAPAGENLQDTALAATALGKTLAPAARLALLAGLDARPAQPSRIICSCFSVSEDAIADVVKSRKLETPAQIGEVLRAGSNCGSCIPELKKLIATQRRIVEPA